MAERYMFFDSVEGEDERFYTADEFAEYFRKLISSGIFNGGENLRVSASGSDMNILINEGYAWIEGYLYKIETESLSLTLDAADSSMNRIDRVVIRLDKSLDKRYVRAFILKGEAAEKPVPPTLNRSNNIYEISLAQVEVLAGKSFIEDYQIIDERLNNEVCGIVTHLFEQVDTRKLFNEWQLYLNAKKAEGDKDFIDFKKYITDKKYNTNIEYATFLTVLQGKLTTFQNTWDIWVDDKLSTLNGEFYLEWNNWFESIQYKWNMWFEKEIKKLWEDWVKDKLKSPDGEFFTEWKAWFEEIQDITNLVPRSQFKDHENRTIKDEAHGLRLSGNSLEVEINKGIWYKLENKPTINTWGGM